MSPPIRVLIVDDHPIVRQGLSLILASQSDMELVAEAANADEAIELAEKTSPDVHLVDLVMPGKGGLTVIKEVRQRDPAARILVLTTLANDDNISAAMELNVNGFHLKDSDPHSLLEAIRLVHRGYKAFHSTIKAKLAQGLKPSSHIYELLTEREVDVLRLLSKGLSNREMASQLHVSVRTVTTHVRTILNKLQVENRTQAAIYAHELGLTSVRNMS